MPGFHRLLRGFETTLLCGQFIRESIAFSDDSGNDLHFTAPLADDLERFLSIGVVEAGRKRRRA